MVFVTNYHKLGDLNNKSALSCSSVSQKSDTALNGLKSGLAGICSFLEALGENLFPCLFQLLGVTSFLGFMAIFLHFPLPQTLPLVTRNLFHFFIILFVFHI